MHVEALDHIHIYSVDPAASAEFYEHHFDGTIVQRHEEGTVLLALGGKILIFSPVPEGVAPARPPAFAGGARTPGVGVAHIGLRVADVKAAVDELTRERRDPRAAGRRTRHHLCLRRRARRRRPRADAIRDSQLSRPLPRTEVEKGAAPGVRGCPGPYPRLRPATPRPRRPRQTLASERGSGTTVNCC